MEAEIIIKNKSGLHARPAAQLVAFAKKYPEKITLVKGEKAAPATSLLGILGLGIAMGDRIRLSVEGERAEHVMAELQAYLERSAYEE